MKNSDCLLLLLVSSAIVISSGLDCWKCVGPDCDDTSMEQSEFSERVTCEDGGACQKTWLEYYDLDMNMTRVSMAVRSCSYSLGCNEILDITDCVANRQEYAGLGCERRYCCETDMCNSAVMTSTNAIALLSTVVAAVFCQLLR